MTLPVARSVCLGLRATAWCVIKVPRAHVANVRPPLTRPGRRRRIKRDTKDISASGWAPPAEINTSFPYIVHRTSNGYFPVYTDYRNGRTRVFTILRRAEGDIKALASELTTYLGGNAPKIRLGGMVFKGNVSHELREWLRAHGF